jgi:hypothetical protein
MWKRITPVFVAMLTGCAGAAPAPAETQPPVAKLFPNAPVIAQSTDGETFRFAASGSREVQPDLRGARDVASFGAFALLDATPREILCVVQSDGAVACKGSGAYGGLPFAPSATCANTNPSLFASDATYPCEPSLRVVEGLAPAKAIAGACVLGEAGEVSCWPFAQQHGGPNAPPTRMDLPARATAIAATIYEACAVLETGEVRCWGLPSLDLPACADHPCAAPAQVPGLADVDGIALAVAHGCALQRDGHASCWGVGKFGANGDGAFEDRRKATRVAGDLRFSALATDDFQRSCAITTDAKLACWGAAIHADPARPGVTLDAHGLAIGRSTPALVTGVDDVAQVALWNGAAWVRHVDGTVDRIDDPNGATKIVSISK